MGETGLTRSDTPSNVPHPKSVTYIDHDDPFVLADQASGDPNIRQLSRNSWVYCGDDIYVLELLGKGYIRVSPIEGADQGMFSGRQRRHTLVLMIGSRYRCGSQVHRPLHLAHYAQRDRIHVEDLTL